MRGSPHRFARWLRLVLACLALAGSGAPAHAAPRVDVVVAVAHATVSPEARRSPLRPVQGREAGFTGARPRSHAPRAALRREKRAPGPPRRLFLQHRALLR